MGYAKPTPIQAQAIPVLMNGRDLIGIAQTGTGKTAAFALPILNRLIADKRPAPQGGARVLVLSPTRELASQIAQSFRDLSAGLPLNIAVVFGGVPHGAQIRALARGLDVLVATPGRLLDHLDARVANLSAVEFLVLDEVDQMLDLGFIKPIRRIVRDLPRKRQNLFFSATMPPDIRQLAGELLHDPHEVSVAPAATTVDRVEQTVVHVDAPRKRDMLVELFADASLTRTIVFTRTKHGADRVARTLDEAGISALAIHGNKSQGQRERALAAFRSGAARALVATDIAAR
ncbi:MAG: DEAD/DEAH box helicase, partial [Roseiarcus sp.]